MKQQEEVTMQSLAENKDVQVGYLDDDILIVDSIQRFAEVKTAHVMMNAIVVCFSGKVQAKMNGQVIALEKNQVAIIPENIVVTEVMITPDFDMKAMFLTKRILQSFLREKMNIWDNMMYVHRLHIITMEDTDLRFYTHFYEMITLAIEKGKDAPFYTDIVQALLRAAILGLCSGMKLLIPQQEKNGVLTLTPNTHFHHFLDLLHKNEVKRHTVEWYASELCITPKYLSAICKANSGKTAIEWIREHVLEDIRYYLSQTDLNVAQIADRLGFPNPSFFGKYVKEHFGMTPLQFRLK